MSFAKALSAACCFAVVISSNAHAETNWKCYGAVSILKEPVKLIATTNQEGLVRAELNVQYDQNQNLIRPLIQSQPSLGANKIVHDLSLLDPRLGILVSYDVKLIFSDYQRQSAKALIVSKHLSICLDNSGKEIDLFKYDVADIDTARCAQLRTTLDLLNCSKSAN